MSHSMIKAKAAMLIRKPAAEVFEAFVDPEITSKFWFNIGSVRLEAGKTVQWDWEMYDVSAQVLVKEIESGKRILIEWPTRVEWIFTPDGDDATFVSITDSGFQAAPLRQHSALAHCRSFAAAVSQKRCVLED